MIANPVLIVGARSDIGMALARRFAAAGHPVLMSARGSAELAADAADIGLRHGTSASVHELDILDTASFAAFFDSLRVLPGIAICVVGLLGDQEAAQRDHAAAALTMRSNYEGPALLCGLIAERFAARGTGTIIGISSVAGERGRASNYIYGSAKAGFTAFLSGLRSRFAGTGVHVMTVLPGFVRTRMTAGMDLNPRLTAEPAAIAEAIFRAAAKQRDVIYVKPVWRLIMTIIKALPEPIFKRTKL
jgi:short-subunit dehydrogenase